MNTNDKISEKSDENNININQQRKGTAKMLKSKANGKESNLDDPAVERDVAVLVKKYLKGDALKDILANIPYIVYFIVYGYPKDVE